VADLSPSACAQRCKNFIGPKLYAWSDGHKWRDYSLRIVL
jgi:hypothetical protein